MSTQPAKDPWIQRPRPRPEARLRLLLLPHAGGGASMFRGWTDALPPDVEVCPVQLPGRENRMMEKAFDRMDPLVETLAGVLERWRDLPYAVFGHSNGAAVGFELARRARRTGTPGPVHLFASGRRAPDIPSRLPDVAALPDAEMIEELSRLGGIPREVTQHPELMQLLLPLLRADMALIETYEFREEPPLPIPITVYTGLSDPRVTMDEAEAWARHTAAGYRIRTFPGDHFYLAGGSGSVLAALSADLRGVIAGL
ncbi:thioesterase II family protein [Longimicrobium sp.]|uniref:thioesterase II family protein n=1 Tax=Longimicrobium sp. TaxID=2029185 RepID=UPI002C855BA4|nr:thioesterase domain-containing protein [Longimicrobium sp.]HSU14809.1 thioesterase domain-containing protein [Longimicrobium sp.]